MNLLLMNILIVATLLTVSVTTAQPVGAEEAIVEIIKQKLIKFPDDQEPQPPHLTKQANQTKQNDDDEAKRILAQIAKVNQALGYVKKQPPTTRLPPILDSSQYLFPKPAYHPFHEQNHQIAGAHGETLLVPSIRSYRVPSDYRDDAKVFNYNIPPKQETNDLSNVHKYTGATASDAYEQSQFMHQSFNVPPHKNNLNNLYNVNADELPIPNLQLGIQDFFQTPPPMEQHGNSHNVALTTGAQRIDKPEDIELTPSSTTLASLSSSSLSPSSSSSHTPMPFHYFFRPQQVHVPAPETPAERKQLPTHFVMPVRLYKLNKSEYVEKFNPQEYKIKGYKIVGDIDNFYGKTKHKLISSSSSKTKSTPKYHLFFLPREILLNAQRENSQITEHESLPSTHQAEHEHTLQATSPPKMVSMSSVTPQSAHDATLQREEKLANRPFKLQTTASSSSSISTTHKNGANNNNTTTTNSHTSSNSNTQIIRKRIVPKPLRPKDQTVSSIAAQPSVSDGSSSGIGTSIAGGIGSGIAGGISSNIAGSGGSSTGSGSGSAHSATSIKFSTAPLPIQTQDTAVPTQSPSSLQPAANAAHANTNTNANAPTNANSNANLNSNSNANAHGNVNSGNTNKMGNNFGFWPLGNLRPSANANGNNNNNNNVLQNAAENNGTASNVIKNAFQNIFRLPFRPDRPVVSQINDAGAGAGAGAAAGDGAVAVTNLQSVPLQQVPQKTFFSNVASHLRPQAPVYVQQPQPVQTQPQFILPPHPIYQSSSSSNNNNNNQDDYKWDDEANSSSNSNQSDADDEVSIGGDGETDGAEKKIFGHLQHHHNQQQATQQEAIKQGGIIIQRLKVRKGGIAIAGPGGVATAGSGGTAIVGPGGYALTHPRSLTIAGPGAKVIAIPATVDLQDALQRTNLKDQTLPREGRIVATGPIIYYAPSTGAGTGTAPTE